MEAGLDQSPQQLLVWHQSGCVDMCLWGMQSELAMLRAEVRTLANQLKDAENLVSSQVRLLHIIYCFLSIEYRCCIRSTQS